jgi:pilus assembly protein CpaD
MTRTHLPVPAAKRRGIGASAARLLGVLGCATMLAGCYATERGVVGVVPSDVRQRHPIAIREGVRTVEVLIGSKRGGLSGEQRADVLAFANRWRREATGGVVIDLPSGTRNEIAAANALHEVRAILSAGGIPPQGIAVRPYQPNDVSRFAPLRLNYPTMVAEAGPCGLWPKDLGPTFDREHSENLEYFNFGCAAQRNLAAMVDNKADLVQPRGEVPPYTGRRTTVLDKFHRGEGTATTYPDADKGKISDVGK